MKHCTGFYTGSLKTFKELSYDQNFGGCFIFLLGVSPASVGKLGFDFKAACGVFEEALSLNDKPEVMAKYVRDNLQYRVESEEVIEADQAVSS